MLKRILRFIIRLTAAGTLLLVLFLLFLRSNLNPKIDQKVVQEIITEVEGSPELPKRFAEFFNQYHNSQKLIPHLYDIFNSNKSECPCVWATSILSFNTDRSIIMSNQYVYAAHIIKKVSNRQCLNLIAYQYDFLYNTTSLKRASRLYFNKELNELNDIELQTFVIMMKNPLLYNPIRNPENLKKQLEFFNPEIP